MGVSGLFEWARMGAAQRVQLVDEFRRRTDGTSNVLIIDGLGAIYTLLYPKGLDWSRGGQWASIFHRVKLLVSSSRESGIELVVVFDGPSSTAKASENRSRTEARVKEARKAAQGLVEGRVTFKTVRLVPPQSIASWLEVAFVTAGARVVRAAAEGDRAIAELCQQENAFGVVADDSDFCIFDGVPRLFILSEIDRGGLDTDGPHSGMRIQTWTVDMIAASEMERLTGLPRPLLPLFASLCGNDYMGVSVHILKKELEKMCNMPIVQHGPPVADPLSQALQGLNYHPERVAAFVRATGKPNIVTILEAAIAHQKEPQMQLSTPRSGQSMVDLQHIAQRQGFQVECAQPHRLPVSGNSQFVGAVFLLNGPNFTGKEGVLNSGWIFGESASSKKAATHSAAKRAGFLLTNMVGEDQETATISSLDDICNDNENTDVQIQQWIESTTRCACLISGLRASESVKFRRQLIASRNEYCLRSTVPIPEVHPRLRDACGMKEAMIPANLHELLWSRNLFKVLVKGGRKIGRLLEGGSDQFLPSHFDALLLRRLQYGLLLTSLGGSAQLVEEDFTSMPCQITIMMPVKSWQDKLYVEESTLPDNVCKVPPLFLATREGLLTCQSLCAATMKLKSLSFLAACIHSSEHGANLVHSLTYLAEEASGVATTDSIFCVCVNILRNSGLNYYEMMTLLVQHTMLSHRYGLGLSTSCLPEEQMPTILPPSMHCLARYQTVLNAVLSLHSLCGSPLLGEHSVASRETCANPTEIQEYIDGRLFHLIYVAGPTFVEEHILTDRERQTLSRLKASFMNSCVEAAVNEAAPIEQECKQDLLAQISLQKVAEECGDRDRHSTQCPPTFISAVTEVDLPQAQSSTQFHVAYSVQRIGKDKQSNQSGNASIVKAPALDWNQVEVHLIPPSCRADTIDVVKPQQNEGGVAGHTILATLHELLDREKQYQYSEKYTPVPSSLSGQRLFKCELEVRRVDGSSTFTFSGSAQLSKRKAKMSAAEQLLSSYAAQGNTFSTPVRRKMVSPLSQSALIVVAVAVGVVYLWRSQRRA